MAIGDKRALPLAVCNKVPDENGNITLSVEDIAELEAALRNKAFLKQPPNGINCDNEYNFNGVTPYSDKRMGTFPPGSPEWMNIVTLNPGSFFASQLGFGLNSTGTAQGLSFRSRWADNPDATWFPWITLATGTPPEEHDLPLAEGVTRGKRCVYSKAQDSLVVVRFSATFPAAPGRQQIIGTLPVDYRPSEATEGAGKVGHASGDTASAASVELWEDGRLTVYGNTTGFTNASGMVVFYAV